MQLSEKKCKPCEGGTPPLSPAQAKELLAQAPGWALDGDSKSISREFTQETYWESLAFANAVGWIAQSEKHHPDMMVAYKKVKVLFSTHSIGGLSENDLICAAKVNALKP